VPGKPGEPIPPAGVPPSEGIGDLPDMQVPGQSAEVPQPGGIPGQENTGPAEGTTTTLPMPEEQGLDLIFSQAGEGAKGVPPSLVGNSGELPAGIGGRG